MRHSAIVLLVLLCACGGRAPQAVHSSWEPTFGQYVFEGSLVGRAPVTVSGTLTLGPEGFSLSSTHGSCRERLSRPWVAPWVSVSCSGIRLAFRLAGEGPIEDGTATVTLQQTQEGQHCTLNADGTQRCITVEQRVDAPTEVRIHVRRQG